MEEVTHSSIPYSGQVSSDNCGDLHVHWLLGRTHYYWLTTESVLQCLLAATCCSAANWKRGEHKAKLHSWWNPGRFT